MLLDMIIIVLLYVVIVRLYEIRAFAQIPLEATQKADDLSIGLRNMTIMHRKYCNTTASTTTVTTITVGVTAESAVTPTVIVVLSHHALSPAVIDSDSIDILLIAIGNGLISRKSGALRVTS